MMLTDKEIGAIFRELVVVDDDGLIYGLEEACRAVIAANNEKVLADLKPATVDQVEEAYDAWELSGDASTREPMFYLDSQVSALIQNTEH